MTEKDVFAITGRSALLIIALALIGNRRPVSESWHIIEVFVICACIVIRERILYHRWLKIIKRGQEKGDLPDV